MFSFSAPSGYSLGDDLRGLLDGASVKTYGLAGLQGLTSAAGLMSQMAATRRQGQQSKTDAYLSAQDELLNATQAYVSAQGQISGLKTQLSDTIGARLANAGGSGIDGGQGVIQDNAAQITGREMAAEKIIRGNADIAAGRARINAWTDIMRGEQADANARAQARAQLGGGILSGLLTAGKLALAYPTGGASLGL